MTRRTEIGLWVSLIALAAVAGIAIAGVPQLGASDDPQAVATPPAIETTEPGDTDDSMPGLDTTTTTSTTRPTTTTAPEVPELRPNSEVTVLVVNGTTVPGAAGRLADQLSDEGYPNLTPTSTRSYQASEVWFTGDFGPEAAELAERLGVFPENVMAMPADPGITVGSAEVIVIVGPDLAEEE